MNSKKFAKNLIDFIYNSPTAFHAVSTSKELLDANGFIELDSCKMWDVKVGGKYYITKNSSAIVAFTVNSDNIEKEGFRIIGSHSDSPSFRIKPNAEIESEKAYLKLNESLEKDNYLIKELENRLGVDKEDIVDFDLFLYEFEKGCLIGANEEFISSGRLDNLAMAHASLNALINANSNKGINIVAVFDNEEVGSSTKQGADSNMLLNILERICISLGKTREEFFTSMYSSFMISSDLAHAVHPNIPEKHDPTNRPVMGKGPVIKINANQAYTSDAYSISIYKSICKESGVKYQEFVNRSDERGGSTLGPISSTHIDIPSVDVGTPILAMHSIRELGSVDDHYSIYKTFHKFYEI